MYRCPDCKVKLIDDGKGGYAHPLPLRLNKREDGMHSFCRVFVQTAWDEVLALLERRGLLVNGQVPPDEIVTMHEAVQGRPFSVRFTTHARLDQGEAIILIADIERTTGER